MNPSYELLHIGINCEAEPQAQTLATLLADTFHLAPRQGQKSVFAGSQFECMKSPYLGTHGHIAMGTPDLAAAMKDLSEKGLSFLMETAQYDDEGNIKNIYLEGEFGGFAIHVMKK